MSDLAPDLFGIVDLAVPRAQRSAVTNRPMRRQKGTTKNGRRLRDIYISLMVALGHPTDIIMAQTAAIKAAELMLAAEIARAALLGGSEDANVVVRLENLADRAVRRLGLSELGERRHVPLRKRLATQVATGMAPESLTAFREALSMRERLAQGAASVAAEDI